MVKLLWVLLFLILAAFVGWHIFFALVSGTIIITSGAWAILTVSIFAISLGILFFFLFAGLWLFIFAIILGLWVLMALLLFPLFLPILLPLLLIFIFVAYKKKKQKKHDD